MTKTDTDLVYPEPRLAARPWADYGDENPGEDGRDPSPARRDPGPGVSDGISHPGGRSPPDVIMMHADFGQVEFHAANWARASRLSVPRFLCFECGAQFEDDPDPQYGDCPHCRHAGAVGLADSEED